MELEKYFTTVEIFWCLRCLKDYIDLPDNIQSFTIGATNSILAKNGTKKNYSTTMDKITSGEILVFEVSK